MTHADLVREGMARTAASGVHVGRPTVLAAPNVAQSWPMVCRRIESGEISRREATRLLGVGEATVRRMLAARPKSDSGATGGSSPSRTPGGRGLVDGR